MTFFRVRALPPPLFDTAPISRTWEITAPTIAYRSRRKLQQQTEDEDEWLESRIESKEKSRRKDDDDND